MAGRQRLLRGFVHATGFPLRLAQDIRYACIQVRGRDTSGRQYKLWGGLFRSRTQARMGTARNSAGPAQCAKSDRCKPTGRGGIPMKVSATKFTSTTLAIAGLLASLSLGACSRSEHLTNSLVGPAKSTSGT